MAIILTCTDNRNQCNLSYSRQSLVPLIHIMPELTTRLRNHLDSFNLLTREEIDDFLGLVTHKHLKKGQFLIQQGRICDRIAYIGSGIFRSYYYSSASEEITYCLTFSDSFVSAYSSFLSQNATVENIQALTDADLLVIPRHELLKLEASGTNWLKLMKHIAEQEYIKMEERIFILQKETAETRYKDLLKKQPELLQLIPLNYLASYLGITQRHLSRIRKSLSN